MMHFLKLYKVTTWYLDYYSSSLLIMSLVLSNYIFINPLLPKHLYFNFQFFVETLNESALDLKYLTQPIQMKFFFCYFLGYNCLYLFFFAYGNTKEMKQIKLSKNGFRNFIKIDLKVELTF
jgi:hypothetical protein